MSATIASLNKYAEEFGITEVLPSYSWLQSAGYIPLTAKSHELLRN